MSGKNIQKLHVINPSVLKSLLEQLNANTKRQTIANIISESGMNEIIRDYDNFVAAPEKSAIKESLKENLYSRIRQYKNKSRQNLRNQTNGENNHEGNGDDGGAGGGGSSSNDFQRQWQTKTVKTFRNRLSTKNIRSSRDGFFITSTGKKTNSF